MAYRVVKRKSVLVHNKKVYVLRDSKTGYYKQADLGERAEFHSKKEADKELKRIKKFNKRFK